MAGLVRTVLDLRAKVETFERKYEKNGNDELKAIIEKQEVLDKAIAANSDAIGKIDEEIKEAEKSKQNKVPRDMLQNKDDDKAGNEHQKRKKCRYYNRGYCKYTNKCRFIHPRHICSMYMESNKCTKVNCNERHPKECKWNEKAGGCRRQGCDYAHGKEISNYKCEGCKDVWEDKS